VAQGTAGSAAAGPSIPNIGIMPFTIDHPDQTDTFPEQTLATPSSFRSSGAQLTGITQAMVNDPNARPGRRNRHTAFLKGGAADPNVVAASATATFWLQTLPGQTAPGPGLSARRTVSGRPWWLCSDACSMKLTFWTG
jgi:hypothetical protein